MSVSAEKQREYGRKWKRTHRDQVKAQKVEYRKRHPEKQRIYNNKCRTPERDKVWKKNRRSWLAQGSCTKADLELIYHAHAGLCFYCGTPLRSRIFSSTRLIGFDHIISRVCGGTHEPQNIVTCCPRCNTWKAEKTPEYLVGKLVKEGIMPSAAVVRWLKAQAEEVQG